MMFVSLGIGTAVALALIAVVSMITGGAAKNGAPAPALVGTTLTKWTDTGLQAPTVVAPWNTGHATAVVIFASWCGPCRSELSVLSKYLATHRLGRVALLGVDVHDSRAAALAFLQPYRVRMSSVFDPEGRAYDRFRLSAIPDTVFVTSGGVVQNVLMGPISTASFAHDVAALGA